ncbi:n-acetyl-gamma-glutamyl-phosphate reductase [Lasius niger]|uniref:N-acetyl-gamma-glutamyl-phosphate reductase n=1 Tax=Lasius niger TaxID=67767 RepID=A0A0J7NMU5_LASNI|nr:n-acetyl-gamma-glutamyl-phosphate reductase [Lasius niger]
MMEKADITILCLPDAVARQAVTLAEKTNTRILDASSAHRTEEGWVYGFAELKAGQAKKIAYARKVSNPGCYATGAIAILRPLMEAGIIPENYPISLHGISGYSGGGNNMISAWESGNAPAFELYALNQEHKHLPEIQKYASLKREPLFVPSVGKFVQGMIVFCPLENDLLKRHSSLEEIREILTQYYADFSKEAGMGIEVLKAEAVMSRQRLAPESMAGRDDLLLRVHGTNKGRTLISAHFDNLGKGAAGAALSNLLLMHKGRLGRI